MADPYGIREPVDFDHAAAEALASDLRTVAATLEAQVGERGSLRAATRVFWPGSPGVRLLKAAEAR